MNRQMIERLVNYVNMHPEILCAFQRSPFDSNDTENILLNIHSASILNVNMLLFIICRFQATWSRNFTRNWELNDLAMLKLFWPSTADYWVLARNKCKHSFKFFFVTKTNISIHIFFFLMLIHVYLGLNTIEVMLGTKLYHQLLPNQSQFCWCLLFCLLSTFFFGCSFFWLKPSGTQSTKIM